jgi:hypothetical protein
MTIRCFWPPAPDRAILCRPRSRNLQVTIEWTRKSIVSDSKSWYQVEHCQLYMLDQELRRLDWPHSNPTEYWNELFLDTDYKSFSGGGKGKYVGSWLTRLMHLRWSARW